ncbi:uncharacterized protein BCR38DRAFT_163232 [Pseudomassariella vexata]|uniref:BZIP domain-containing protein n=1 Tax=Pseudomassariella vexata TaxID=1141098 RepID=A0A1Y2E805_9PEZI|nr:uncharacterized protein BCR38DRAFT_163232 [Pseudomassariella vexata]ORY67703.1 hypothetical protein BCR38DRAFT_163232 [Pseudomassariella vexata]
MMDFSHGYYSGAQPYQFIGIPPLTPSASNSAGSDEFNNQSPPDVYDHFQSNDHFQNFNQYAQFNHQTQQTIPGPPGPPTPPTHPSAHAQSQPPPAAAATAGVPVVKNNHADILPLTKADPDQGRNNASNSDDDDMTPAQSRRKAQNRAAQRAFRERKERHVKDLEAKLASLEAAQHMTASENEKLKRDLQKMSIENEILRATSSIQQNQNGSLSPPSTTTGPMSYNPTDFYSDLLANHTNKTPSHRIVESEAGERLLAAGATWEFIINHEMFKRGLVDIGDVSERLKPQARCDGQGPVFEERAIIKAIQESVASGSDELL